MITENKNIEQQSKDKACAKAMQSDNKVEAQIAFNKIYKRYKSPIFYLALRFVKMNKETADDLTQEIFVKVFEKIKNYDHSVAFTTWMYKLANNHIIDFKRKEKVEVLSINVLSIHPDCSGDLDAGETPFQLEDKSADTFIGVVRNERALAVIEALNNGVKSEDAKQIIALIFLDEMSYEKVAEQVKMPLGTVKALMFRAKAEMKNYLSVESRDFSFGKVFEKTHKWKTSKEAFGQ